VIGLPEIGAATTCGLCGKPVEGITAPTTVPGIGALCAPCLQESDAERVRLLTQAQRRADTQHREWLLGAKSAKTGARQLQRRLFSRSK
jgi:hypothetical protein